MNSAALKKNRKLIKLLLKYGADAKVKPDSSKAVLDAAASRIIQAASGKGFWRGLLGLQEGVQKRSVLINRTCLPGALET